MGDNDAVPAVKKMALQVFLLISILHCLMTINDALP
jgi:hypothetical protein